MIRSEMMMICKQNKSYLAKRSESLYRREIIDIRVGVDESIICNTRFINI